MRGGFGGFAGRQTQPNGIGNNGMSNNMRGMDSSNMNMGGIGGRGTNNQNFGNSGISIAGNQKIEIKDSEGNTVYSTQSIKNADCIIYCSDDLDENERYTLYVGQNEIATATVAASDGSTDGPKENDEFPSDDNKEQPDGKGTSIDDDKEQSDESETGLTDDENASGDSDSRENIVGDINQDGQIDMKDSALLKRYLAGWEVDINLTLADANGDGVIDVKDSALIKRYLAGWKVSFTEI